MLILRATYYRIRLMNHGISMLMCMIMLNMIAILSWDMYSVTRKHHLEQQLFIKTLARNGSPQRLQLEGHYVYYEGRQDRDRSPLNIWPHFGHPTSDRILDQIHYKPNASKTKKNKLILFYFGLDVIPRGNEIFKSESCSTTSCYLTDNRNLLLEADVVVFQNNVPNATFIATFRRPPGQIWIWFALESPVHSVSVLPFR